MRIQRTILALLCVAALALGAPKSDTPTTGPERIIASFNHQGTLDSAISALAKQTKEPIHVDWDALDKAGVTRHSTLTINAKNTALGDLIELMLAKVSKAGKPIVWMTYNSTMWVTTQPKAMTLNSGSSTVVAAGQAPRKAAPAVTRPRPRPASGMTIQFDKTALEDVIAVFRKQTGVNFHVSWAALEAENITRKTPVTINVSNVSTTRALDLVCDSISTTPDDKLARVYWTIDKGIVLISTGTAFQTKMRTKVYPIADLLVLQPSFRGPRVNVDSIGQNSGANTGGSGSGSSQSLFKETDDNTTKSEPTKVELKEKRREAIVDIVKNSIGKDFWDPIGKGTIQILGDKLIITQSILGFELLRQSRL
ncbi:MAG: hypothetical protein HN909_01060 [Phycisphaerales bacterium]|jgi:hypothetical protein|nr:hypothetical protein [Phycisphaerales bacterium]MBT7170338.1 hypothetical protein [Phycisphaerales bacterium]